MGGVGSTVGSPVSVILLFCLLLNTLAVLLPFLEMRSYAFSVIFVFICGVSDYGIALECLFLFICLIGII